MVIAVLVVLGLCFGSFVNALVFRLHAQSKKLSAISYQLSASDLSILKGRSMCPHCHHELAAKDLVPVLSWLMLRGRCRYCHKPIVVQYPLIEVATAALFVISYLYWPQSLHSLYVPSVQNLIFGLWLVLLVGLMALLVYDIRWMLLPNKLVFPLLGVATVQAVLVVATAERPLTAFIGIFWAVLIGGGLFYVLFQVSSGKWIGGGDVKLGFLLGMLAGSPSHSLLVIFLAGLLGSLVSLPLLAAKKLGRSSVIPFGPFLIVAGIITVLFGANIIDWYRHLFSL